jgi:hypothetical protein
VAARASKQMKVDQCKMFMSMLEQNSTAQHQSPQEFKGTNKSHHVVTASSKSMRVPTGEFNRMMNAGQEERPDETP